MYNTFNKFRQYLTSIDKEEKLMKQNESEIKKVFCFRPRKCISCGKIIWVGKYWCKPIKNYSKYSELYATDKLICCKKCANCKNDMDKIMDTWAFKKPLWTFLKK